MYASRRQPRTSVCAHLGFLGALTLGSVVSLATPTSIAGAAGPAEAEAKDVRTLFEEGRARYETLDYDGAIELWTKAYAQVPATEDNRDIRNNLVYNIAAAQEKAFELNGEVTHLRQARGLLQRYMDEYKAMYKPTEEARQEVTKVKERIAELDAKIAGAEQAVATQPTPAAPAAAPAPDPRREERDRLRRQKLEQRRLLNEDPEISRLNSSGKGMVGGGAALIAVGGIAALVGVTWSQVSGSTAARTSRNRVGGYTTLGIGFGMMAGGVALVVIGSKRRKDAKQKALDKASQIAVVPALAPGFGGVALAGRF